MFSDIGVKRKQGDVCIAIAELDDRAERYDSAIEWYTKALRCFRILTANGQNVPGGTGRSSSVEGRVCRSIKSSLLAIDLARNLMTIINI